MTLKQYTYPCYLWRDLVKEVEKKAGKSIRDWDGKWLAGLSDKKKYKSKKYLDFWHFALTNYFGDISNGSIHYFCPSNFIQNKFYKKDLWVKEILEYFIKVFEENNLPKEIEVRIDW